MVQAVAKYIRVSPRKMQLLADSVRRLTARDAVARLAFINKSGARDLRQVILSAIANAKQKNLDGELVFQALSVHPGGALKRFRAVSRGMAHEYKKRMSHVRIVLTEKTKEVHMHKEEKAKVQMTNVKSNPKSK